MSAISEAGAILVSAKVHNGWSLSEVARNQGMISRPDAGPSEGVHALVLVGWDTTGFLVLNSAGPGWGSYKELPGIAHWSYQDWSERVLDGWVLQLGASTPDAFDLYQRPQGLFGGTLSVEEAKRTATNIPRSHLLGHYAHLNDARHVETGTFPSSRESVDVTFNLLREKNKGPKPEPLVLWLAGGIEGLESATRTARQRKLYFEKLGSYFYTVFWCQDVIDAARPVLGLLFDLAIKRAGAEEEGTAETMQAVVQGIGRAVWRDLHNAAKRSASSEPRRGDARHLFETALNGDVGGVHVAADGLGAVLLAALYADAGPGAFPTLASMSLVAPAITLTAFKTVLAPVMNQLPEGRSAVILPSADFDGRMVTGPYPHSILHLAANAFEEQEGGKPPIMAGTPQAAGPIRRSSPRTSVLKIDPPEKPMELDHSALTRSSKVLDAIAGICGF